MQVRTFAAAVAAALVVSSLGGCVSWVSLEDSLDTSFGPGATALTYRVGGERDDSQFIESRVTVIERADTMVTAADTADPSAESAAQAQGMPTDGQTMPGQMPDQMPGQPMQANQPMPGEPAISSAPEMPNGMPH